MNEEISKEEYDSLLKILEAVANSQVVVGSERARIHSLNKGMGVDIYGSWIITAFEDSSGKNYKIVETAKQLLEKFKRK